MTAAALFDGHDASINIVRRLLQAQGAEVIHLGHDRPVEEVVTAVLQEAADAVAVSSYQGGHVEYFRYLVDRLRLAGAGHVRVYGGGGGVFSPDEIAELEEYGVARIFTPEDGQRLGLEGMIRELLDDCTLSPEVEPERELDRLAQAEPVAIGRLISWLETEAERDAGQVAAVRAALERRADGAAAPVVGFTGTGGAGKSSLIDELVRRHLREFPGSSVGIVLVDPTLRRSGGALLGDRLRLNALEPPRVFVRSLATRRAHLALSRAVSDSVRVLRAAGFDLIFVETAGIGQSDSEIVDLVDLSLYVMTPEYGAASQLEKIDMLDLADLVVLNKSDRRGAEDALRDVRRQRQRTRGQEAGVESVHPTTASRWGDPGTDALYRALTGELVARGFSGFETGQPCAPASARPEVIVPAQRSRYLADVVDAVRGYRARSDVQAQAAAQAQGLWRALRALDDPAPDGPQAYPDAALDQAETSPEILRLRRLYNQALQDLGAELCELLSTWSETRARYDRATQVVLAGGREIQVENRVETLSGLEVPKVAVPRTDDWGEIVRYLALENVPGAFPFTAGVFPFKRTDSEDPTRMFAGEGTPERTNRRFHLLCLGQPAVRLSTAFDSVTLYGRDPNESPDVWGKVGTSGVSVCTVDDAKKLYSGFDLLDPKTSVSMTINGPAPVILAFFLNAVIDQAVERHLGETGQLAAVERARGGVDAPGYSGDLPEGHSGLGLRLLGVAGDEVVDRETYSRIRADALRRVRGTVQADILKEDQAQNTCIFSTDFALRMMGDIQEYLTENHARSFYSVSISGYHMAEAGANPITQLAFTLANAFTYCEYYLARGLATDDFASNLSFFFSHGLDPEYSVIGRVARRIWAIAMRDRYGAGPGGQRLKYHIQTSGRSLHAQEMAFNDIRTTLQALTAVEDHCNSLHTNAYDEAVTTPTEASVRRALAIQLILYREFGRLVNENPGQGSYLTEALTERVEDAVLLELQRLSDRGGVLGAMESNYQRGKIQDESLRYEARKHTGELPIIGVNTFQNPSPEAPPPARELVRSSELERRAQLENLQAFQARNRDRAPQALGQLQAVALSGGNVFESLMDVVKVASLGQISAALFEVGGQYRRAM